ncbi:porin [Acidobacteriota bacterium]
MRTKLTYTFIVALLLLTPMLTYGQAEYDQGKKLYELKCGRCHFAYSPQKYSVEEWKTIISDMGPLSGLNQKSEESIMGYLEQESKGTEKSDLPTNPVLSGYLYSEFFTAKDITDTFDAHYLNLNINGRLHDRVSYRAEFELEHGGGSANPPFVEQAYLDVRLFNNTYVKIGAILTPFNRFDEFHAPLENLLITRPQMSREIGVSAWKEVGIDFHGNLFFGQQFYLSYDAYVINGLGDGSRLRSSRHYRDNNDAKSFGFRLSGVYADIVEVGTSYYTGKWDDEGEMSLSMFGLHFMGTFGDLNLFGEYSRATSENPTPLTEGKANGYFIQGSYLLKDKFRPVIRYGTLDYLDMGNLRGRSPRDKDLKVIAIGFNYYLTKMIVFKIEYDFILEGDRAESKDNNLLAFQAAVRF